MKRSNHLPLHPNVQPINVPGNSDNHVQETIVATPGSQFD